MVLKFSIASGTSVALLTTFGKQKTCSGHVSLPSYDVIIGTAAEPFPIVHTVTGRDLIDKNETIPCDLDQYLTGY